MKELALMEFFLLLGHPPEWRLHQSVVCHEDIPHTQHPHHHDLVLETDHPHEQTSCATGEVRPHLFPRGVLCSLLYCLHQVDYFIKFITLDILIATDHPKMGNTCN